jgi:hypothetical protein
MRVGGGLLETSRAVRRRDLDDLSTAAPERVKVPLLVLSALGRDELGRVRPRPLECETPGGHLEVEVGEVLALEEVDEVASREEEVVPQTLHAEAAV